MEGDNFIIHSYEETFLAVVSMANFLTFKVFVAIVVSCVRWCDKCVNVVYT